MKPDKPLIAILMQREHNRLINQVHSLEKLLHHPYSDKQYNRLLEITRKLMQMGTDKTLHLLSRLLSVFEPNT